MSPVLIDVREKDEFDAEHVECSTHLPLSSFHRDAPAFFRTLEGETIQILCRSGKRAQLALHQAKAFTPPSCTLEIYPGGILEWKKRGNPTVITRPSHFPIMRQVQLIAGSLALGSVALSFTLDQRFALIAGVVGAGLTVAGATGFCGMAEILALMPWNKTERKAS